MIRTSLIYSIKVWITTALVGSMIFAVIRSVTAYHVIHNPRFNGLFNDIHFSMLTSGLLESIAFSPLAEILILPGVLVSLLLMQRYSIHFKMYKWILTAEAVLFPMAPLWVLLVYGVANKDSSLQNLISAISYISVIWFYQLDRTPKNA